MADWGIEFISNEPKTAAEEAAFAYKDIEGVMAASADLGSGRCAASSRSAS